MERPAPAGTERIAFGLIGSFVTSTGPTVSVAELITVPDDAYVASIDGTAWTSNFTARLVSDALKRALGVLLVHSHGLSTRPYLSFTDLKGFRTLNTRLHSLIPERPHGSLVLGGNFSVGGVISFPQSQGGGVRRIERARWTENPMHLVPPRPAPRLADDGVYDRQALLIGKAGQRLLAGSTVGVVGLGGGGSHVVQQLAHAGVGKLVLVDHDTIEPSNLSRLVGAGPADVGRPKTEVLKRLVLTINPFAVVDVIAERFPSSGGIGKLREVDALVCCVDTLTARIELQKFGWRYLVPLLDIGIGTQLAGFGDPRRAVAVAGHVHLYLPGGPCMWCSGLVSRDKLLAEGGGLGPEYVAGAASPAQVVCLNGVVASAAVVELIQLLTGFMERSSEKAFLTYDFLNCRSYSVLPRSNEPCPHARGELAMGDPVGFAMLKPGQATSSARPE
jgi:molybdopterin/thiamine biosynthesis adenylyltransferase